MIMPGCMNKRKNKFRYNERIQRCLGLVLGIKGPLKHEEALAALLRVDERLRLKSKVATKPGLWPSLPAHH